MNYASGKLPSAQNHSFARIPTAEIPRSVFMRDSEYKTTLDAGYLVPFYIDEALPGDSVNFNATLFGRLTTQLVPIMDNMRMKTYFFAIPNRLVWSNFVKMMGEQANPADSIDYTTPTLPRPASTGFAVHSVADYFGIPTGVVGATGFSVNALPFRAYNLVWNEWFRDQNLQNSATVSVGNGPDAISTYPLLRKNKSHDYFTSCLPWPQKGTAVSLPLGSTAPVIGIGAKTRTAPYTNGTVYETGKGATTTNYGFYKDTVGTIDDNSFFIKQSAASSGNPEIYADLSSATAATINSLRLAFQVQRLLERDARGGTRYTEIIRAHFGVVSPDARLQRPEFLGGSETPVIVSVVPDNAGVFAGPTGVSAVGNLAAAATVMGPHNGFTKSFTEHSFILGLVCFEADKTYQQGVPRMFSRSTRYTYYWPALAQIGEQTVLNKEIFVQGTSADDDVFGYQERFAEYRYMPSKITGVLRSDAPSTLDFYHLSQDFATLPTLSDTFIQENPPVSRVVVSSSEPQFILDVHIKSKWARPMPLYGVPGNIDRF